MSWLQIKLPLAERDSQAVETVLLEAGAVAVTFSDAADDPIFEPELGTTPLWADTTVTGLFEQGSNEQTLRKQLVDQLGLNNPELIRCEQLPDQQWERSWLEHFQPKQYGEQLWIVPSAFEPPQPQAVNILLDPGLAFGTGTHPTTALCLEWLDGHAAQLAGQRVIDYGCGSGILAIAAALLGAGRVIATDIDPQAIEATAANAERNGVTQQISGHVVHAEQPWQGESADLLLANILAGPLGELAPQLVALTRGPLVLSGILVEQAEDVIAAYQQAGCQLQQQQWRDGWVLLEFCLQ